MADSGFPDFLILRFQIADGGTGKPPRAQRTQSIRAWSWGRGSGKEEWRR